MPSRLSLPVAYSFLALFVAAHFMLWQRTNHLEARWLNIPPAPSEAGIRGFGLGDTQLAYRAIGIMLQNIGDLNGDATPLKDYNYPMLGQWLMLADRLDGRSQFLPTLAAFYYGRTQDPKELPPVIDYLEMVGRRDQDESWRWLAQAVYLARFRMNDLPRALQLAQELSGLYRPGRPLWVKEMPAFVMTASGDKHAAYALMLAVLKAEAGKVQQPELTTTIAFMCGSILTPAQASTDPVCRTIPASFYQH